MQEADGLSLNWELSRLYWGRLVTNGPQTKLGVLVMSGIAKFKFCV